MRLHVQSSRLGVDSLGQGRPAIEADWICVNGMSWRAPKLWHEAYISSIDFLNDRGLRALPERAF